MTAQAAVGEDVVELALTSLARKDLSQRGHRLQLYHWQFAMFGLSRPVWLLGSVSLATDLASEAISPLLPFFLTNVLSAGAISVGIIDGTAEAANSLLKIV